jgi:hypothetical protein
MQKYINSVLDYFNINDKVAEKIYVPSQLYQPSKMIQVVSAWQGHEQIILDIIKRFKLQTNVLLRVWS